MRPTEATPGVAARPDQGAERLLASLVVGRADPRDVGESDAGALALLAINHGLGTVLLDVVREAGIDPATSPWASLVEYGRWAAARYLASRVEQARIEAALARREIEWVWLKGYALAHAIYPRPALRPMLDLDLLIPVERCEEADRALRAIGYRSSDEVTPPIYAGVERLLHHMKELRSPSGILVELHKRLHPSERLMPAAKLDWLRAQTMETRSANVVVRHLKPEAQLLHVAAHAILNNGEGDLRLQRYYDCHLLVRSIGFDWKVLVDQAVMLGWAYVVQRALANAHDYFSTPVPDHVWNALEAAPTQTPEAAQAIKVAVALKGRGASSEFRKIRAFASSPLSAFYQCFRILVPSTAYMRWRYGSRGRSLPIKYARRWYYMFGRLMKLSLTRLRE